MHAGNKNIDAKGLYFELVGISGKCPKSMASQEVLLFIHNKKRSSNVPIFPLI